MPALILIIALNVAVYALMAAQFGRLDFDAVQAAEFGATYGPFVRQGEYWRLLAANYVHFDLGHIAFNMLALWAWGARVAAQFGAWRFLPFYTLCGVAGSALSVWAMPQVVGAGASGAVSGVLGAMFVLRFAGDRRVKLYDIGAAFAFNAIYSVMMPSIDWRAHAGGFLAGLVLGGLAVASLPRSVETPEEPPEAA